jgi:hypothetical protein
MGTVGAPGGLHYVWGLVPDGNTTVSITAADGTSMTAPVVDNVYLIGSHLSLESISFRNTAGVMTRTPLAFQ